MINFHSQFRNLLLEATNNEIQVYYELFKEKTAIPCISYLENANRDTLKGDTLKYSSISYMVKIWAEDLATVLEIQNKIDAVLDENGFNRTSSNELNDDGLIMKVLNYEGTGYEYKN